MLVATNTSFNLPVPDIRDDVVFQHSYRQSHKREDSNRLRPPKLKPRYYHDSNFNRSHSISSPAVAFAISFRTNGDNISEAEAVPLSYSMDTTTNQTYFEQCFTCLSKIGEGSFGEVFKVQSKQDGYLYAIKMSKQMFRSETYRQERLEEVRRYEQFSGHANCLHFYRAWEQDDRLYMQMELCRESLEHYLERRRQIPEEKIWTILLDLLLALKSLHDRNLIHLDIKLDNVLIGDDESCKLADFGLVIDVDKANRHQATEGDSRYIAPEIMQGVFSKAADIFSLGIAMLELSCYLELPANGPLWQELRSGILPEDFIRNISIELQQIIKQMMTPDPKERPTVDQLLKHKKLRNIITYRQRCRFIRKAKQIIYKSRHIIWSKLCNLKIVCFRFLMGLLTTRKMNLDIEEKPAQTAQKIENKDVPIICTHLISSTPRANEVNNSSFLSDDNCLDFYQSYTPSHFANDKIINSTPVNLNSSGFRSRKDLTKTIFRTLQGIEPLGDDQSNNFMSLEDIETHGQSFVRKPLNLSSVRGKLLFAQGDESE